MKSKIVIFGASGQIGKSLIRKLTKFNYRVVAITRNIHQKGYVLKTQSNPGYLEILETSIFDEKKIEQAIKESDICINLVGILFEKGKVNTFKNIHENFPLMLAKICKRNNIKQFIHLSALGIDRALDSNYASSKLKGEKNIKSNFENYTILRPSIVYSREDSFTTNFMSLLKLLPFFPLYYGGKTIFSPIHCSDLTKIIFNVIDKDIKNLTIDCIGPRKISFKEIIKILLKSIKKQRILIPLPISLAKISALVFEKLPKPLITIDQLKLLKYDNISRGNYKTNFDLNMPSELEFENEVNKYSFMWRDEGQYSKEEYKVED
ncbi:MAG: NADH-ubiquinone oxidoreductase [Candidatus Pelagibacter sp. TMED275]|nr:MAG: NADH-ubiquinone oxidoreductase [Candidatus Pelagibacter sp. TMED275]|tara:strand:- start:24 stop:986 length:963 start_codon:yes stop_codon:yes gene_type:complete